MPHAHSIRWASFIIDLVRVDPPLRNTASSSMHKTLISVRASSSSRITLWPSWLITKISTSGSASLSRRCCLVPWSTATLRPGRVLNTSRAQVKFRVESGALLERQQRRCALLAGERAAALPVVVRENGAWNVVAETAQEISLGWSVRQQQVRDAAERDLFGVGEEVADLLRSRHSHHPVLGAYLNGLHLKTLPVGLLCRRRR